ncbi:MAG: bifunctional hydroxymethylpyrimidine kinase/phosphomethylpyrimidine kinase [Aggregatilineales bacterium]
MIPPRVLTIAGSDSSGAAGAQADLKTFEARGVYGLSALTMLTAQNSTGIQAVFPVPLDFIGQQIDSVLSDMGADAVKTGLLLRADVILLVADKLAHYQLRAVVDPVLIDGRGRHLVDAAAERAYREALFPRALIVTPNLDEAGILTGRDLQNLDDVKDVARMLCATGAQYALVKGGHAPGSEVIDVLYDSHAARFYEFRAPRLPVWNARGTGCTFASVVAAEIVKGQDVPAAVEIAKRYVTEALQAAADWHVGTGRGTVFHAYANGK